LNGPDLLDRQGYVVYVNGSGESLARTGNALRVLNNRLAPLNRAANTAFTETVRQMLANKDTAAKSMAFPASDGKGLIASILPLNQGKRRNWMASWAARIAVFVHSPELAPQMPGEAFARLYGLTGGELRVLLNMVPGLSVKETAHLLGLQENTVKTHLKRAFQKTGTSKQSELIGLLLASTPPVKI